MLIHDVEGWTALKAHVERIQSHIGVNITAFERKLTLFFSAIPLSRFSPLFCCCVFRVEKNALDVINDSETV